MKVIFFGSDSFATQSLLSMLEGGHEVVAVVSRPDRPAGRGLVMAPTSLVNTAMERGLPVLRPEGLSREHFEAAVAGCDWEAGVVVAYGGLIPVWLLERPATGFVNLHPSLLPRYRGAAPIRRALLNGASITGVTTIRMDEGFDSGDILMHAEEPIYEDDTAGTLAERLAPAGAKLLVQTLDFLAKGELEPVPQEDDKATFAPPIATAEGNIDWEQPAEHVDRLVRALNPEPGAYTFFRGKRLKLWSTRITDVPPEDEPGTLMNMGKEGFLVNTGSNCLQVVTVQPEGKARMSAGEFSRGQRLLIAERFSGEP